MKNKIAPIILLALLIPNLAFASWWNPFSWFRKPVVENNKNNVASTTGEPKNIVTPTDPISATKKIASKPIRKVPVLEKTSTSSCDQSCIDKLVNEKYKQEEFQKLQAKSVADEKVRQSQAEILRLAKLRQQEARERATANRVAPTSTTSDTSPMATQSTYSDYAFDYKWSDNNGGGVMSCAPTSRNIVIKKATFKLSSEDVNKLTKLKGFENDGWKYTQTSSFKVSGQEYTLEKRSADTFQYIGGNIGLTCSDRAVFISLCGSISETTEQGRNAGVYATTNGVDTSGGSVCANMSPIMSEWEIYDNTTSKPVKIY